MKTIVLSFLLVAQFLLVWYLVQPEQPTLLTAVIAEVKESHSLTMTSGNGRKVELRKIDDLWILPQWDNFPADQQQVNTLLDLLADQSVSTSVIASSDEAAQRMRVSSDNYNFHIVAKVKDKTYSLYIGTARKRGYYFIRYEQDKTIFSIPLNAVYFNSESYYWADLSKIRFSILDISQVKIKNSLTLLRDEKGNVTAKGLIAADTLQKTAPLEAIRMVSEITVSSALRKSKSTAELIANTSSILAFEVTTRDAKSRYYSLYTIQKESNSQYFLTLSDNDDYVFNIKKDYAEKMIRLLDKNNLIAAR